MRFFSGLLIFLVLFGVAIAFAIVNDQPVGINFLVGQVSWPLSIVILITTGLGLLVGVLVSLMSFLRIRFEYRRCQKRLRQCEQELSNLRALPIRGSLEE